MTTPYASSSLVALAVGLFAAAQICVALHLAALVALFTVSAAALVVLAIVVRSRRAFGGARGLGSMGGGAPPRG